MNAAISERVLRSLVPCSSHCKAPVRTTSRHYARIGACRARRLEAKAALKLVSMSEAGTRWLAEFFAARIEKGDAICLFGDVGSGKSAFW